MTAYVFTARVPQRRVDERRAAFIAEQIVEHLGSNPVLVDPSITVHSRPDEDFPAYFLRSRVCCDGMSQLAVHIAHEASLEQWRDVLAESGLEFAIPVSQLTVWEYAE